MGKLEKFLNRKEIKLKFGASEDGYCIGDYRSGCFEDTKAEVGYSIKSSPGNQHDVFKRKYSVRVAIKDQYVDFICETESEVISVLKSIETKN